MPDVKPVKGFSLYLTVEDYNELGNGKHNADYICGYLAAKMKPVFVSENPPKPAVEHKVEVKDESTKPVGKKA